MRKTLLSLSILAALGLGGCGDKPANTPSAGVSTSAGNSEDMSQRQSLSRDGKETISSSENVSIQMPAWGLLTAMALDFWIENGGGVAFDSDPETVVHPRVLAEEDTRPRAQNVVRGADGCSDDLGARPAGQTNHTDLLALSACGAALAAVDAILQASRGAVGWPRGVGGSSQRAARWSVPKARLMEFANLASTQILRALPSQSLRDEQEAKAHLRARLADLARDGTLAALWQQVQLGGSYTANLSGQSKYPVEFIIGGTMYGRDQAGWHVTKNGVPWFGDGKVSGQDFTIAMQSSSSTDQSQGWSLSQDGGSGTRSETRGEAGIR